MKYIFPETPYVLDMSSLTQNEIAIIERSAGMNFSSILDERKGSLAAFNIGLARVVGFRMNKPISSDLAGSFTMKEMAQLFDILDEEEAEELTAEEAEAPETVDPKDAPAPSPSVNVDYTETAPAPSPSTAYTPE